MKNLYHPNALPAHLREQLPDPNRPIDAPVIPATFKIFEEVFDPIYHGLSENLTKKSVKQDQLIPEFTSVEAVLDFLKNQQNKTLEIPLTLADFVKHIHPFGLSIIETVVATHTNFYPNQAENQLMMTAHYWQNMLAVYLLFHCKARKTLNPDLSLQQLSKQMNGYLIQHQREIEFLTYHSQLTIFSENVAFAILALGGKLSKSGKLENRVTNISANNFLAQFKSI